MGDVLSKLKQVVKTAQEGVDDEFNDVMQMVRGGDPVMLDSVTRARESLERLEAKFKEVEVAK